MHEPEQVKDKLQAAVRMQRHAVYSRTADEPSGTLTHQHRLHHGSNRPNDRLHYLQPLCRAIQKEYGHFTHRISENCPERLLSRNRPIKSRRNASSCYFEGSLHKSSNTYPNAKGKLWKVSAGDESASLKKGYLRTLWDGAAKETAKKITGFCSLRRLMIQRNRNKG